MIFECSPTDSMRSVRNHAFAIERVEGVAAIDLEIAAGKHRAAPKAKIVHVDRIRYDQKRAAGDLLEIRNVVVHRCGIEEKAFLGEDATGRDRLRHHHV